MEKGEHTALFTVGLGVRLDFPKVSIGVGLPFLDKLPTGVLSRLTALWRAGDLKGAVIEGPARPGEVYAKLTTEVVYNVGVDYESAGPYPVIKANCGVVSYNAGLFAGGQLNLFGKRFAVELPVVKDLADDQLLVGDHGLAAGIGTSNCPPVPPVLNAKRNKEREKPEEHRGRLQVQGRDMEHRPNKDGRMVQEISWPWTRSTPLPASEARAALSSLRGQLTRNELSLRDEAFVKAEKFIENQATFGGYSVPPALSRSFQNSRLDDKNSTARVDIEVKAGKAFVP